MRWVEIFSTLSVYSKVRVKTIFLSGWRFVYVRRYFCKILQNFLTISTNKAREYFREFKFFSRQVWSFWNFVSDYKNYKNGEKMLICLVLWCTEHSKSWKFESLWYLLWKLYCTVSSEYINSIAVTCISASQIISSKEWMYHLMKSSCYLNLSVSVETSRVKKSDSQCLSIAFYYFSGYCHEFSSKNTCHCAPRVMH